MLCSKIDCRISLYMYIPEHDRLTTKCLGNIYSKTTATYKYFWFLSILQIHAKTDRLQIDVWDIVIRMVANAWYPVHYSRLSFGRIDSLFEIVMNLQQTIGIPIDADIEKVCEVLRDKIDERQIKSKLRVLTQNVPYRFLRPWIDTSDDKEVTLRSLSFEYKCLYSIHKEEAGFYIEINPAWDTYLHNHYNILVDFTYWNLTQFLQVRNPNVPAISNKLIKPVTRDSLSNQHRFWDTVIELSGSIRCIYTNKELHATEYALDHFIPWSFVSHNLLWNLIPADNSINSSKGDKLPDLSYYLPKLAQLQRHSIQVCVDANKRFNVLEDYLSLGYTVQELANMNDERFIDLFERTFKPMNQIALNMGFETWNYNKLWKQI